MTRSKKSKIKSITFSCVGCSLVVLWLKILALVSLVLCVLGCFSQRGLSSIDIANIDDGATAILPVTQGQVRFVVNASKTTDQRKVELHEKFVQGHEQIAINTNAVLDTLVRKHKGNIIGPTSLKQKLTGVCDPSHLDVILDDPGGFNETWKLEILANIGKKLNMQKIVVVRPRVDLEPLNANSLGTMYSGMSTTASYEGRVTITASLIDLSLSNSIKTRTGQAVFWGKWGLIAAGGYGAAIAIPYGYGKALDRAIEQAALNALTDLLNVQNQVSSEDPQGEQRLEGVQE